MKENLVSIADFDRIVEKKFNSGIGEYIENVKKQHGLSDEDISHLVGKRYTASEPEPYKLIDLTGFQVMRLIELCSDSEEMRGILDSYKRRKNETFEDKLKKLLELLGVDDEKSLDRAIRRMQRRKEGSECTCQSKDSEENKNNLDKPKDAEEACCDNGCKTPNGTGRVTYSYFDSETMDKPEKESFDFEIDPNDFKLTGEDIENMLLGLSRLF